MENNKTQIAVDLFKAVPDHIQEAIIDLIKCLLTEQLSDPADPDSAD